jgi:hypothetical protein
MKPGLVTLADLPALAGGKNRSTIVVARLDDKLRDPRYGAFKITQDDVDGWQRNLASTFGGRVSIDFDHSSDRGGGTRASGWITGLHQDGKLVTADVEWTKRGAKAIRRGDYRHISPTFVANYTDEHGDKHGKALIGAALTNRPVLRQGMPCLSLSADTFDGVATPRNKTGGAPMSKKPKKVEVMVLEGRQLKPKMLTHKQLLKETKRILAQPRIDAQRVLAGPGASPDTVMTLAQYAPPGVAHAGTIDWNPPAAGASREPLGLDDSGRALHGLIANRAASTGTPYFEAMAAVTGIPDYAALSDIPAPLRSLDGLNPDQAALYASARGLAVNAGIGWMDACNYLEHLKELASLQSDTGAADVPWTDTRPLATPPRPWVEEDWERDKRRATAAGIQIGALGPDGQDTQLKAMWQAGAEQGRDIVGEMAEKQRQDAIASLQDWNAGLLDQARAREDDRRSSAINDELTRRARNRVAGNGRPAARRLPGTH